MLGSGFPTVRVAAVGLAVAALLCGVALPQSTSAFHEGPLADRIADCYALAWSVLSGVTTAGHMIAFASEAGPLIRIDGVLVASVEVTQKQAFNQLDSTRRCVESVGKLAAKDTQANRTASKLAEALGAIRKQADVFRRTWDKERRVIIDELGPAADRTHLDQFLDAHSRFGAAMTDEIDKLAPAVQRLIDATR